MTTLPNGMQIVTHNTPRIFSPIERPTVNYGILLHVSAPWAGKNASGAFHFFEHALGGPSRQYPAVDEGSNRIPGVPAEHGAITSATWTLHALTSADRKDRKLSFAALSDKIKAVAGQKVSPYI